MHVFETRSRKSSSTRSKVASAQHYLKGSHLMTSMLLCDDVPKQQPVAEPEVRVSVRGIASAPLDFIDDRDARDLLREHDGLIWLVLNRFRRYVQQQGATRSGIEESDLHLIGQVALLRAWVKWEPARGAWTTVATTYVQRAITRALGLEHRAASEATVVPVPPHVLEDPASMSSTDEGAPNLNFVMLRARCSSSGDATEAVLERQRREWFEQQLRGPLLTPRQQQVVRAMMIAETFSEAALMIGNITRQGVEVQYAAALVKLRKAAINAGF